MRHDPTLARAAAVADETRLVRAVRRWERPIIACFVVMAGLAALAIPGRFLAVAVMAWVR